MWASPFYQQGRLDGEYGFSDLKERIAGRDVGRLGAGVKWQASERTVVGLDYDLDLGRRYVGHRLAATLRVSF